MENKLYIVTTHQGYNQDAREILVGIYDSQWTAEMNREQYLMDLKNWQNKYNPDDIPQLEEDMQSALDDRDYDDWDKTLQDYYNWSRDYPLEYSEKITIECVEVNKKQYQFE